MRLSRAAWAITRDMLLRSGACAASNNHAMPLQRKVFVDQVDFSSVHAYCGACVRSGKRNSVAHGASGMPRCVSMCDSSQTNSVHCRGESLGTHSRGTTVGAQNIRDIKEAS